MNMLQRLQLTVTSQLDRMVGQVENHDAIVAAALKETHAAAAQARVRLMRIEKDGAAMRSRLAALRDEEARWESRATDSAEGDRTKALECLKRRNECRGQIANLIEALNRHEAAQVEITASVKRIESRIGELSQQRNLMRSRHSAADAERVIRHLEGGAGCGIDDVFDRWEMRIAEAEFATGGAGRNDSLNTHFVETEERDALSSELDALLTHQKQ